MTASNFIDVDDARVAYRVHGRGPAIVLINGTAGLDVHWGPLLPTLAEQRTVITLDLSGAGETVDDGAALSLPKLARQVAAVAKAAGASSFDLAGYSLGAAIAIQVATETPAAVRSLISVAGFAWGGGTRLRMLFELWGGLMRTDREAVIRILFFHGLTPGFIDKLGYDTMESMAQSYFAVANWEGLRRQIELGGTVDVRDRATQVACPTLVLTCTHDQFVTQPRAIVDAIPGALYGEVDAGHLAFAEASDQVAAQINLFLNRLNG